MRKANETNKNITTKKKRVNRIEDLPEFERTISLNNNNNNVHKYGLYIYISLIWLAFFQVLLWLGFNSLTFFVDEWFLSFLNLEAYPDHPSTKPKFF